MVPGTSGQLFLVSCEDQHWTFNQIFSQVCNYQSVRARSLYFDTKLDAVQRQLMENVCKNVKKKSLLGHWIEAAMERGCVCLEGGCVLEPGWRFTSIFSHSLTHIHDILITWIWPSNGHNFTFSASCCRNKSLPDTLSDRFRHKCPTYPMPWRSGCCFKRLSAPLFPPFFPHRVSFCRGHTQNFCRRKWASTSEQILPSNRTFPLKSLVLQPGLRVVLCPRFSAENDAAEGPSWDGISTPCAVRLGSPERRNVDRNPERSELWARWSAPTRALLPPLSQLTLGAHSAQTPSHGHSVNYKYSFPVRNVKCLHSGTDFMKLYPWVYAFVQF